METIDLTDQEHASEGENTDLNNQNDLKQEY